MGKTLTLKTTIGLTLVGFLIGVVSTRGQFHLIPLILAAAYVCTEVFYE